MNFKYQSIIDTLCKCSSNDNKFSCALRGICIFGFASMITTLAPI